MWLYWVHFASSIFISAPCGAKYQSKIEWILIIYFIVQAKYLRSGLEKRSSIPPLLHSNCAWCDLSLKIPSLLRFGEADSSYTMMMEDSPRPNENLVPMHCLFKTAFLSFWIVSSHFAGSRQRSFSWQNGKTRRKVRFVVVSTSTRAHVF